MLDLRSTIDLSKITRHLDGMDDRIVAGAQDGLEKGAKALHRSAYDWLSGAAGSPGAYPVPVVTGNLRRLLDWLGPNSQKSSEDGSYATGPLEVLIYDAAAYADVIHDGTYSSTKFGPREYLSDPMRDLQSEIHDKVEASIAEHIKKGKS